MRRRGRPIALSLVFAVAAIGVAQAQGRGGPNWTTTGGDAQRTSWVKTDPRISRESLQKPGFQLLWKSKLENQPRQLESLTQPMLLSNIISYKGFKALAFVGGSSDNVYSIDYDLNKMFWKRHLNTLPPAAGNLSCPGAMTTITRATPLGAAMPAAPAAAGAPPGPRGGNTNVYAISSGGHAAHAQSADRRRPDAAGQVSAAECQGDRRRADRPDPVCRNARRLRFRAERRLCHRPFQQREAGDAMGSQRRERRWKRRADLRHRRQPVRGDRRRRRGQLERRQRRGCARSADAEAEGLVFAGEDRLHGVARRVSVQGQAPDRRGECRRPAVRAGCRVARRRRPSNAAVGERTVFDVRRLCARRAGDGGGGGRLEVDLRGGRPATARQT